MYAENRTFLRIRIILGFKGAQEVQLYLLLFLTPITAVVIDLDGAGAWAEAFVSPWVDVAFRIQVLWALKISDQLLI